MLDFHSHVLPGVDDGSKDLKTTKKMLELLKNQGVDCVCATPHFYYDELSPQTFFENRKRAVDEVLKNIDKSERPSIVAGAEVYYFSGMEMFEEIEDFCLEGTDFLLLELPFSRWNSAVYSSLEKLKRNRDIVPVIAHYERYFSYNPPRISLERIVETGALIQCNTSFFTRILTRRKALKMLKDGFVQFIGTDCHNLDTRRPNFSEAVDIIYKKLGAVGTEDLNFWERTVLSDKAVLL